MIAFTAAFMALLALAFYKTTLGILVQAIALNRDIAEAMGTNAPRISSMVFALGTGVAGMAGVLARAAGATEGVRISVDVAE